MHIYDSRRVFNDAKIALIKAYVSTGMSVSDATKAVDNAVLSQSYLRLECIASTATAGYQWAVVVNNTTSTGSNMVRPTENRLNLQDAFYVGSIQMLVGLALNANDTQFPLFTFNNPDKFTTAGAADALFNFYNGKIALTVNNRVITPAWDILRHYKANQTQFVTGAASPKDQFDGGLDGTYPSEPNWVLIGSKNSLINATLPNAIGTLQADLTTVLAIVCRGVLAQNVTVVN